MNLAPAFKRYDAILVAGEGKASYKVCDQHKAFLKIDDKYVVNYVVEALREVESVNDIYIVGSREKLARAIEEGGIDTQSPKRIFVVEQKDNLYENIWYTFLKTLPPYESEIELEHSKYRDRAVLIVPCDSPLITAHEIEYFISKCDLDHYDHILGLTAEKDLEYFYPKENQPGIKMAYLNLREAKYRINNLHMVKPIRIENRHYIQKMYRYRYQRNIKNVILFGLSVIGKDKPMSYQFYIGLQLGLLFNSLKFHRLADFFSSWTPKKELEASISRILKTRFMGLEVPFPGATLDIDNYNDWETLKLRFDEWRAYLRRLDQKYPLPYRHEYTFDIMAQTPHTPQSEI